MLLKVCAPVPILKIRKEDGGTVMKVDSNITLYAGAQPGSSAEQNRKTIFAGDLNRNQESPLRDRMAEKRAEAQEKAMKFVSEAFQGELQIDESMEESRQHVKELQEENVGLRDGLAEIAKRQETLEAAKADGELDEEAYRQELKDLNEERTVQEQKLAQNQGQIEGENASVRGTRLERLKYHTMADAWGRADDVMAAANDEIVGMAMQEGVDHVDEEAEKREEQAEEIKEEKQEQEELREKQKERKAEEETWIEELSPEEFADLAKSSEDVQKEIQDMLRKMNLLDEDLKGAAVDESL